MCTGCQTTWSPFQVPREEKSQEKGGSHSWGGGGLLLNLVLPSLPQQLEILTCPRLPPPHPLLSLPAPQQRQSAPSHLHTLEFSGFHLKRPLKGDSTVSWARTF